jgi:ADP-L-glycero-D-manno-heptose 6-epimerase
VYASSAATTATAARHGRPRGRRGAAAAGTLNAYGYSKHLFDSVGGRAASLGRLVGCKFFNVFGPNEDHKGDMRSLVHKATRSARAVTLFAATVRYRDGEQMRDSCT